MITKNGVAVPEDMATALSTDAEGLKAFEALRPDDQRVYVDWITKSNGTADGAGRARPRLPASPRRGARLAAPARRLLSAPWQ
jgi:hypothetical protein